ncbi:MAG: polyprenyl synthetase family protein [Thermodesulfobacteriota bacterium]
MHIQEAFALIKDDISRVDEEFRRNLSSDVPLIRKVGEHILSSGGKRFRPLILLLSARLCGYGGERHIPLAGVVEFLHTATLLHDDVVDNADLRRGAASANAIWGNGVSVLVGDYLLSKAFFNAVDYGDLRALKVLAHTTTVMAEGEVLQLLRHSDVETSEEDHLDVITRKTSVLFSASARLAAIVAGVSSEKEEALARYGLEVGLAYQFTDDCLDYTSNDEDLGKAVGNDLREGKVTLPLIKAYRDSSSEERAVIKRAIEADELDSVLLREVMGLINAHGGIEYTLDRARSHMEEARKSLDIFEPDARRAALLAVADYVIERPS